VNLVDSSAWLEYLADGPAAQLFEGTITRTQDLLVPVICVYEVFKRVLQQRGEESALRVVALMQQGKIVDLDSSIALSAAKRSIEYGLPMADGHHPRHGTGAWCRDLDPGCRFQEYQRREIFP